MPQSRTRTSTSREPGARHRRPRSSPGRRSAQISSSSWECSLSGWWSWLVLWAGRQAKAGGSGPLRAAQEQAGTCPERDDAHSGGGHDLLRAVEAVAVDVEVVAASASGDGDGGVEQEQEPEHRLAVE